MSESTSKPGSMALKCLGGDEPAADLLLGLKDLRAWPQGAKAHLWDALGLAVAYPLPKDLDTRLEAFRRQHEVPPGRFARAITACHRLLNETGRRNLDQAQLEADLVVLAGSDRELVDRLLSGFDRAMDGIKRQILHSSLSDHGSLLLGVDWRVDLMVRSHRGEELKTPVIQMTLRCLEGKQENRKTVQVLPEQLRELQAMCEQILGTGDGPSATPKPSPS